MCFFFVFFSFYRSDGRTDEREREVKVNLNFFPREERSARLKFQFFLLEREYLYAYISREKQNSTAAAAAFRDYGTTVFLFFFVAR